MVQDKINIYLRNPKARFGTANYSYVKDLQYQIIDRKTGKHYYYSDIQKRNKAFKKLLNKAKRKSYSDPVLNMLGP